MGLVKYHEKNTEINEERAMLCKQSSVPIFYSSTPIHTETFKINIIKAKGGKKKVIVCRDCGTSFNFTAAEQRFYAQHELCLPKRCICCRNKRKESAMVNLK